ncbi:MAG: M14/M99 family metallopeptidase [Desulfomonilaceae bacterium]|nr:M14/M99 family metallopeptidase [Desulfomonilaceae bacterium]
MPVVMGFDLEGHPVGSRVAGDAETADRVSVRPDPWDRRTSRTLWALRRGWWRTAFLVVLLALPFSAWAETHRTVHFRGTDAELDVITIKGLHSGPTLLILGGIQGDEPGGYLAADLYADLTLKKGNLIVVPRANFLSIVENSRGVEGDMNRKFAGRTKPSDRDAAIVSILKSLMKQSDFFLNLHDGSGFYASRWESPDRNPMRYGQSIIIDADRFIGPDGKVIEMGNMVRRVLETVNPQIPDPDHHFHLNNHRTLQEDTKHREQRLSATFHAVTRVGIPAFGIETSKNLSDYRLRVRYQTMVVNAFLEEVGIVPDNPRMYLENPQLKYVILSVNGNTPIVVTGRDRVEVQKGDTIKIVHIESNYSRGLTARLRRVPRRLNDMGKEIIVRANSIIEVRKDRFLMAEIPVDVIEGRSQARTGLHFEPRVRFFSIRVNDRTMLIEPGEELRVMRGDTLTILDPLTNMAEEDEKSVRVDLRGFQASSSPYPVEDRGHHINTAGDLQEKYAAKRGTLSVFSLQAKLGNRAFDECFIAVEEPRMHYVVLSDAQSRSFIVHPDDRVELPAHAVVKIMDIRTNIEMPGALFITMSGKTLRWSEAGSAGIDASKLSPSDTALDITRGGRSLGRIWLKRGKELRLTSDRNRIHAPLLPVGYQ